jgi:hypothetical protein
VVEAVLGGVLARVGEDAGERRGRRGFRRAQPHGVVGGARTAREVARERPQRGLARRRRLAHADAAEAARLVDPRARRDQAGDVTRPGQVDEDLPGRRVDVEADGIGRLAALHDLGGHREVAEAGVGGRAQHHLVDRGPGGLADGDDVAGRGRLRDQRFECAEVDLVLDVVGRALVGGQLDEVVFTLFGA